MALAAMRFEQAQEEGFACPEVIRRNRHDGEYDRASDTDSRRPRTGLFRPARAGNRTSDAARQVGERFRKNGGNSIADAAELIRLNGEL